MEWFSGPIPDAIGASRTDNKLFVVFIYDSEEASTSLLSSINKCSDTLKKSAVAIKLENDSEEAKLFGQLYPFSSVPSLFFIIAVNGRSVDIITESLSEDNLLSKINEIVAKANEENSTTTPSQPQASSSSSVPEGVARSASPSSQPQDSSSSSPPEEVSLECDGDLCRVVPKDTEENKTDTPAKPESASEASSSSTQSTTSASLEERIARAKVLAQQKQQVKEHEKGEKELSDEIQRREMGKEMRRIKKEQDDKAMKDLAEKRRKDKLDDKLARERVKAQIVADKAERETRAALLRGEGPPPLPPTVSPPTPSTHVPADGMCRLKLRLPDGSSTIASFSVSATLLDVHKHVKDNVKRSFTQFKLASSVLQRPFTSDDMGRTLTQLGLVPSAIIVIMPTGNSRNAGVVSNSSSDGFMSTLMWLVITPITTAIGYIRVFLFGEPNPTTAPTANTSRENSPQEENANKRKRTDRPKTEQGNLPDRIEPTHPPLPPRVPEGWKRPTQRVMPQPRVAPPPQVPVDVERPILVEITNSDERTQQSITMSHLNNMMRNIQSTQYKRLERMLEEERLRGTAPKALLQSYRNLQKALQLLP